MCLSWYKCCRFAPADKHTRKSKLSNQLHRKYSNKKDDHRLKPMCVRPFFCCLFYIFYSDKWYVLIHLVCINDSFVYKNYAKCMVLYRQSLLLCLNLYDTLESSRINKMSNEIKNKSTFLRVNVKFCHRHFKNSYDTIFSTIKYRHAKMTSSFWYQWWWIKKPQSPPWDTYKA